MKDERDTLLERAWGLIANAGEGDWKRESETWQAAAAAWRDRYFGSLGPPVEMVDQPLGAQRQPWATTGDRDLLHLRIRDLERVRPIVFSDLFDIRARLRELESRVLG